MKGYLRVHQKKSFFSPLTGECRHEVTIVTYLMRRVFALSSSATTMRCTYEHEVHLLFIFFLFVKLFPIPFIALVLTLKRFFSIKLTYNRVNLCIKKNSHVMHPFSSHTPRHQNFLVPQSAYLF